MPDPQGGQQVSFHPKPPVRLMEQYLGPVAEWAHLRLYHILERFQARGWDVKDTDDIGETFEKIEKGCLARRRP